MANQDPLLFSKTCTKPKASTRLPRIKPVLTEGTLAKRAKTTFLRSIQLRADKENAMPLKVAHLSYSKNEIKENLEDLKSLEIKQFGEYFEDRLVSHKPRPKINLKSIMEKLNQDSVLVAILNRFQKENPSFNDLNDKQLAISLFQCYINFIQEKKWFYANDSLEEAHTENPFEQEQNFRIKTNCFGLSEMLFKLFSLFELNNFKKLVYHNEYSLPLGKKHNHVYGSFTCFDPIAKPRFERRNNRFHFIQHCVVQGNGIFFDPTFCCYFTKRDAIFEQDLHHQAFKALASNHLHYFHYLKTQKGFNINATDCTNGWTFLHWAAHKNELELAEDLIKAGIDANIPNNKGKIPYAMPKIKPSMQRLLEKNTRPEMIRFYHSQREKLSLLATKMHGNETDNHDAALRIASK